MKTDGENRTVSVNIEVVDVKAEPESGGK